jgi:hypothetical protein
VSSAFKYSFNVHGKVPFPLPMLSMEGCFPTTVADCARMVESFMLPAPLMPLLEDQPPEQEPFIINLTIITTDRYWQPKIEWWNKQGWTVGATRIEYNERTI